MPNPEEILTTVVEVLSRHAPRERLAAAKPEEIPLLSLGISSSDVIAVVLDLEEHYGLPVEDEYIHKLKTIGDVVREIQARID